MAFTIALNESVPGEFMQYYGMFIGGGYCTGIFLSNFVGLAVPLDEGKPDDLIKILDDQNWRLVFGLPILLSGFAFVLIAFVF